jgi:deoxyribonuclease-1-like protein
MRRLIVVGLLAALAVGGAYCYVHYNFEIRRGQDGLESITVTPKADGSAPAGSPGHSANGALRRLIRIATFNLTGLDEKKLADRRISTVLAQVIRRFDVVAVQEIRAGNLGVLVRLVEQVNTAGGQYDFATYPRAMPDAAGQYSAFLLNRASIEIDRSTVQSVADPQQQFRHRPLVALFRAKGPDPVEAFTFKLINVHIDPDRADVEVELLDDVYKAVRDDQPNEDDVILLGDFGTAGEGPTRLGERLHITSSTTDTPTTLRGIRPVDYIMFDPRATAEFTGRAGVLDLMREFDLTWREVSEVSDHLPVWAEFNSFEGAMSAHVVDHGGRTIR